jgi:hypothetical protein
MGKVTLDTSHWPLTVVNSPAEASEDDLRELYRAYHECAQRGRYAQLLDFTALDPLRAPATIRALAADFEKDYIAKVPNSVVCEARVVPHAASRGVVTAFDWLVGKAPWPIKNCATKAEALAWIASQLEAAGLKLPEP